MRVPTKRLGAVLEVGLVTLIVLMLGGLLLGYRPVVLTTDSMSPSAPSGTMLIVATVDSDDVAVGDILVMRRRSGVLLTHRVVELDRTNDPAIAMTKGDANEARDPRPYELEGQQRVSRMIVPGIGFVLTSFIGDVTRTALILCLLAVAAAGFSRLRRLEATSTDEPVAEENFENVDKSSIDGL